LLTDRIINTLSSGILVAQRWMACLSMRIVMLAYLICRLSSVHWYMASLHRLRSARDIAYFPDNEQSDDK